MDTGAPSTLLPHLDALGIAAWIAEPRSLQLTAATRAARALLDLRLSDPLPSWLERVHPEDRPALLQAADRCALDQRVRAPGGGWRWLRVEVRGTPEGLLAVGTCTDAVRAAAASRAEAHFDALVENLPFDFFEMDTQGVYVRRNAKARELWGDPTGVRLEDMAADEENRATWARLNARALAGEVIHEEVDLVVHGERRRFMSLVAPVREGGAITGILGLNIDISARRQAEQRSEALVGELRKSLEALDEAQLRLVSRERLAALGELAAVVAHEVRNPLGAIFNSVTQLQKMRLGASGAELLVGIIAEEASRLDGMVGNLLNYARPIHAQRTPELLEPILREALQASLRAAGEDVERFETRVEVSPELGPVPVDPQLLHMALTNIFTNALQAMPDGGRLWISAAPEARDGTTWAEVQVRDTGRGIPSEHLPRIFEPFFTTRAAGTGLGLAVVRRIVEAHHGVVVALSEPGQGSTFALYLPR